MPGGYCTLGIRNQNSLDVTQQGKQISGIDMLVEAIFTLKIVVITLFIVVNHDAAPLAPIFGFLPYEVPLAAVRCRMTHMAQYFEYRIVFEPRFVDTHN